MRIQHDGPTGLTASRPLANEIADLILLAMYTCGFQARPDNFDNPAFITPVAINAQDVDKALEQSIEI
jgi:hypothetical protein